MFKTPKITILVYELIINNKLYENGVITEEQRDNVCKIIHQKAKKYKEVDNEIL